MNSLQEPCFFALSESRAAGLATAHEAGLPLADLEERTFDGGEFKLRPLESVRGRTTIIFQSLAGTMSAPAPERLLRLLFLISGLRDAGAESRFVLVPYLAYARKDRRTQPRDPVYTRYVAELLETAGTDHLLALDVHNPAALDNAFRINVDHLSALPMLADHFAARFPDTALVVASPDIGGIKRAQLFQQILEKRLGRDTELAFVDKRRAGGVVSGGTLVGMKADRPVVILLDDLCATGGTLIRAADICRTGGAAEVHVAVTHIPQRSGVAAITSAATIDSVVVTDSVGISGHAGTDALPTGKKLTCLSIAPLLGQAVRRLVAGRPLTPLLDRWPVTLDDF
jgi:ribose-phosphate pyrophosphokinase